jgi:hypothetical protein
MSNGFALSYPDFVLSIRNSNRLPPGFSTLPYSQSAEKAVETSL